MIYIELIFPALFRKEKKGKKKCLNNSQKNKNSEEINRGIHALLRIQPADTHSIGLLHYTRHSGFTYFREQILSQSKLE